MNNRDAYWINYGKEAKRLRKKLKHAQSRELERELRLLISWFEERED